MMLETWLENLALIKGAGGTTLRISIFCRVDLQLLEEDILCNDEWEILKLQVHWIRNESLCEGHYNTYANN